jgi:hypothetical protein
LSSRWALKIVYRLLRWRLKLFIVFSVGAKFSEP